MTDTPTPPDGWYPDPAGGGGLRRWNGTSWTDEVRSADGASSASTEGADAAAHDDRADAAVAGDVAEHDAVGRDAAGYDAAGHDAAGDVAGHDAVGHDAAGYVAEHDAAGHDAAGHDAAGDVAERGPVEHDAVGDDALGHDDAGGHDAAGHDAVGAAAGLDAAAYGAGGHDDHSVAADSHDSDADRVNPDPLGSVDRQASVEAPGETGVHESAQTHGSSGSAAAAAAAGAVGGAAAAGVASAHGSSTDSGAASGSGAAPGYGAAAGSGATPGYGATPTSAPAYGSTPAYRSAPGYPNAPAYPASTPAGYDAAPRRDIKTNTVWIWLIVALPLVSVLSLFLFDWGSYIRDSVYADLASGGMGGPSMAGSLVTIVASVVSLVLAALTVLFAFLDWRQLRARGVDRPFHWAWSFTVLAIGTGLVYIIGRGVVLRRRTGSGLAPVWAAIAVTVVTLIIGSVWLVMILGQVFAVIQELQYMYGY